jgi:hypothetical protein
MFYVFIAYAYVRLNKENQIQSAGAWVSIAKFEYSDTEKARSYLGPG